jgi:hypothetical protein
VDKIAYIVNPSHAQLFSFIENSAGLCPASGRKAVRYAIDNNQDIYFWDSTYPHCQFGLSLPDHGCRFLRNEEQMKMEIALSGSPPSSDYWRFCRNTGTRLAQENYITDTAALNYIQSQLRGVK